MEINKLKLRNVVKNYEITEQEFEYAGTSGIVVDENMIKQIISVRMK